MYNNFTFISIYHNFFIKENYDMKQSKYKNYFLLTIILICFTLIPQFAHGATSVKTGLVNYSVSIDLSGKGNLYWDYGDNMEFFLETGPQEYNETCKIIDNETYKFSKVFNRGIIAKPNSGHYFSGFYQSGKKVKLTTTNIDILRVKVDGIYYYDYYDAYNNPKYRNYTEEAYKNKVKKYLKAIYGTSRYTVVDSLILYEIPKKDANYTAKFYSKKKPDIHYNKTYTKNLDSKQFYIIPSMPAQYEYTFKSSNTKVVKVNKQTGYATITGPGISTITCTIAETDKTLSDSYKIKVTVKPGKITILNATKRTKKTVAVSWKKDSRNSGYVIEISNNNTFKNILAKKTINSGKTGSTTISLKNELCNNYLRIRAYKISSGKKIYGSYTITKIKK